MQAHEDEEQEKGTLASKATFLKDAGVIHLKLPCSLNLVFLFILASRMLCLLVSHFYSLVLLENHILILRVVFHHMRTNVFRPLLYLCLVFHFLFLHFNTKDSRQEEEMLEGEEKHNHI
jgi:hypothetical protein